MDVSCFWSSGEISCSDRNGIIRISKTDERSRYSTLGQYSLYKADSAKHLTMQIASRVYGIRKTPHGDMVYITKDLT